MDRSESFKSTSDPHNGESTLPTAASEFPSRAVLEDFAEAVITIAPGGTIELFNRAAEEMFGYTSREMVGWPFSNLFDHIDRATLDCYLADVFSNDIAEIAGLGRELTGCNKEGRLFPLRLSASDRQLDNGTFTAVLREDAERLRRQQSLRRRHELLDDIRKVLSMAIANCSERLVFDGMLDALLRATECRYGFVGEVCRDNSRPYLKMLAVSNIAWNDETRQKYRKLTSEGIEFHDLDTLFGAVLREQAPVIANDVTADPRYRGFPLGHIPFDSFMGLPFFGEGRLLGMVGVADRTGGFNGQLVEFLDPLLSACSAIVEGCRLQRQNAENERELRAARDAAEAATVAKSDFLAAVSHEVRTPMTAIMGFADILIGTSNNVQTLDAAKTIKSNGKFLLDVINDILDLSKIEAGKLDVELAACSPTQIVSEVATLMRIRAQEKGLSLEIDFQAGVPETLKTDPRRIKQVLINLVGNAIKFSNEGKVTIRTSWVDGPTARSGQLQFEVADTGVGMTPGQMSKVFRPFVQAEKSTSRRFGGTGLGLAISKRIVELLGGDIKVESSPGRGSTFTVTIAARVVDLAPTDRTESPQSASANESQPLEGRRVLLAEDGFDNQRFISFVLQKAGATVVFAENGRIAVDLALAARKDDRPFDVILMDLQMPEMDGFEATRHLRSDDYGGPIIALSAHAMSDYRTSALDVGCDGYATKPIEAGVLVPMVAGYCK